MKMLYWGSLFCLMASASEEQAPQKPADGTTVVIMDGTSEKMISIEGMAAITIRANLIEIKVKQQKEDKCTLF